MTKKKAAGIGHNKPPKTTPFDEVSTEIENLYGEAKLWIDGEPINSERSEAGVQTILRSLQAAAKKADKQRLEDNKPFQDKMKANNAAYKVLTDKAALAVSSCHALLKPWLQAQETARLAAEVAQRKAAAEAERVAQDAIRAAKAAETESLEEREKAEALVKDAKAAAIGVRVAAKPRDVKGTVGRRVSLRKVYTPVVEDYVALAKHYWERPTERRQIEELLFRLVKAEVRDNKAAVIPGVRVGIEEVPV